MLESDFYLRIWLDKNNMKEYLLETFNKTFKIYEEN